MGLWLHCNWCNYCNWYLWTFFPLRKQFATGETFRTTRQSENLQYHPQNFPIHSDIFQTTWKLCRPSGKYQNHLRYFKTLQKLSWPSWNFPYHPETFQTMWELFKPPSNFPDHPETFQNIPNFAEHPKQTWYLSKILHYQIFRLKILHRKST